MKFLNKFRRSGGEETDGQPTSTVPGFAAQAPGASPSPAPGDPEDQGGFAPDIRTDSSFMESSIEASPANVHVNVSPAAEPAKKEKGGRFSAKVPRFRKRTNSKEKDEGRKEPMVVVPSFDKSYEYNESSIDAEPVNAPITQPPPTKEVQKGTGGLFGKKAPKIGKRTGKKEPTAAVPAFERPVEYRPKKNEELSEEMQEQIAMDTFQYRIHQSRASGYSQYGQLKAPGFDYLNWRPYGYPRYPRSNPESYLQQIHALVPYVYDVVVSGCQGVEERRWDALTKSADEHAQTAENSRDVSRLGSRSQSRDRLVDM